MNRIILRIVIAVLALTIVISTAMFVFDAVHADAPAVAVVIETGNAQPRSIEAATAQAVTRAYTAAWLDLGDALKNNDAAALNNAFVGYAHDRFTAQVKEQAKHGISVHLVEHGHSATAVFYSIDGSALEIRDNVNLEKQVFDGGKMIASETKTLPYVAILTVVEDRWKLRVLQEAEP